MIFRKQVLMSNFCQVMLLKRAVTEVLGKYKDGNT